MKKTLMIVPYFFLWVIYFLFTLEDRNKYMMGKHKGMYCYKVENGLNSSTYYFDPKRKPEREYITWTEFWSTKGY